MKKTFTLFSLLITGMSAFAQLTQSNHAPANGDTYATYQCDSTGISPGGSGASVTWNFAAVTTHSSLLSSYICANASNGAYPQANVQVSAGANVTYYKSSATSLDYHGGNISVGNVAASLNYTAPLMRAIYPMSLNSQTNTAIAGTLNMTAPVATTGTFSGTGAVIADGTGTLTLPGASIPFYNVIRLMTNQAFSFTTAVAPGNPGTLNELRWDYYANGYKQAVFSIITTTVVTLVGTQTQTLVLRDKDAVAVALAEQGDWSEAITLYPNPAASNLYIKDLSGKAGKVTLCDMQGRMLLSQTINAETTVLSTDELSQGVYLCQVSDSKGKVLRTLKVLKD